LFLLPSFSPNLIIEIIVILSVSEESQRSFVRD
jgi:hypothetical protein